jgi:undecaprenyl-diphosphatase
MEIVLQAIVIGVLQGLTEFIPVSSSAHLELAPWILGFGTGGMLSSLAFDVFLHLGTLVALLLYFRRDWARLIRALVASVAERRIGDDPDRRLAWLLALATVPAAIIGFLGEDWIASVLHSESGGVRLAIAGFLVVGAAGLWIADRLGSRRDELDRLNVPSALVIGFSQSVALLPGISRSGATITAGLALGFTREAAARFSFLLATPITLGAGLYGSRHLLTETHTGTEWLAIGAGFVAAVVFGMLAIGFLLSWLRTRSVAVFSLYRLLFAGLIVILVVIGR